MRKRPQRARNTQSIPRVNLLFLQKSADRGGSKRSLLETLSFLRSESGIESRVVVGREGELTQACKQIGVPFTVALLPEWRKLLGRLRFTGAMQALSRENCCSRVDWVISNEMWWAPHASSLARLIGCRSAVILRDGCASLKKSLQYNLNQNTLILPVSSDIARPLELNDAFKDRVHLLFNSVSQPTEDPRETVLLKQQLVRFSKVKRWLLVLGKVSARKNQSDAVRVAKRLIDAGHDDIGLLLAGDIDPSYRTKLDCITRDCVMTDRIALLGNFEAVGSLMKIAEAVLLTSQREGLPRSLVEGILAGKQAFSYPCEGIADIFGNQKDYFTSEFADPLSLSGTVLKAWYHHSATETALRTVREGVVQRFSPRAHIARLKALINA
jgi:glycosyltransferase involved in cell wall biosynthesis